MAVFVVSFRLQGRGRGKAAVEEALDRYTHSWLSDSCVALASDKDLDALWADFVPAMDDGCAALHLLALDGRWKGDGGGSSDQWLGIHLDGIS